MISVFFLKFQIVLGFSEEKKIPTAYSKGKTSKKERKSKVTFKRNPRDRHHEMSNNRFPDIKMYECLAYVQCRSSCFR